MGGQDDPDVYDRDKDKPSAVCRRRSIVNEERVWREPVARYCTSDPVAYRIERSRLSYIIYRRLILRCLSLKDRHKLIVFINCKKATFFACTHVKTVLFICNDINLFPV